jgi:CubicO group peptidase (beta-lactamase class C family)
MRKLRNLLRLRLGAAFVLIWGLIWLVLPAAAFSEPAQLSELLREAERLTPLKAVIVAQHGTVLTERGYRGHSAAAPANIKSASKGVMSALVGIAIDRGILEGVDQPVAPLLADDLPDDPDPRLAQLTIGHLLTMQSGLVRTSGRNYGRWILSDNWVRAALAQPFVDDPGGDMLYSTGSTHLLSAILTRVTGRSTLALAQDWLAPVTEFHIQDWQRDPQGIYFGGNQMAMSTRSLLAFGELYRRCGATASGQQIVASEWIAESWRPRTRSQFTGDDYGYGWFLRRFGRHDVAYAWGYGGQMLYVIPTLEATVAITSNDDVPASRNGHRDQLHDLLGRIIDILEPPIASQMVTERADTCGPLPQSAPPQASR